MEESARGGGVSAPIDYEAVGWGADSIRPGEHSIAGFRLEEALAHLPESGRVLEVGCGGGRYLRALRGLRPGLALVGADVSRSALARLAALAPEIETRPMRDAALPAADGEFDAVLVIDVLEHVAEPRRLLAEARRALAPGGLLHLHVPCEGDPLSLWAWLPGQKGEAALKRRFGGHVQRFRRAEVLDLLRANGFAPLRVRHSLHLLGNLADVAAFLRLAAARRGDGCVRTTGDLIAQGGWLLRAVDAALWCEARLLGRVPSWSVHVSARRR
jgi:SAM-dependent methyltransferase